MRCRVRECLLDTYDAPKRQTYAIDVAGSTTFTYDAYGQLTSEQVSGLYSKTLTRHYDTYGRNVGYSVDNERKQSIVYDSATGRISESDGFKWTYLPRTNPKSSLTYPNEDVVSWTSEPHRDFLSAVTNATYSIYVYTNDLLGRRTSKNDEQYSYNVRDELISADDTSYAYDDIGNRTTAEGKTYTANNLNQYTAIDDFTPQYDADGNQTLIKTETGIWSVVYNAENRPIRWQSGDTVITMSFDRIGRRIEMRTQSADSDLLQHFVYDNYLCIRACRRKHNINCYLIVLDMIMFYDQPFQLLPPIRIDRSLSKSVFLIESAIISLYCCKDYYTTRKLYRLGWQNFWILLKKYPCHIDKEFARSYFISFFHIFLVEAKKMTLDEREFYKKYQPKKDCILTYLQT